MKRALVLLFLLGVCSAFGAGCGSSVGVGADEDAQRTLDETVSADTMSGTLVETPTTP